MFFSLKSKAATTSVMTAIPTYVTIFLWFLLARFDHVRAYRISSLIYVYAFYNDDGIRSLSFGTRSAPISITPAPAMNCFIPCDFAPGLSFP